MCYIVRHNYCFVISRFVDFFLILPNRCGGSMLEREFNYYLSHQSELVEKYNNKVIVIKGDNVIGVYESEIDAIETTSKEHEIGTFLVQKCLPGNDSYTMTFHSRVVFA
jgi:hypothetical protein